MIIDTGFGRRLRYSMNYLNRLALIAWIFVYIAMISLATNSRNINHTVYQKTSLNLVFQYNKSMLVRILTSYWL